MTTTVLPLSPGIQRQEQYVALQSAAGDDSLIVGAAFLRGIRDLGYQSTAKAIDEEIDNSIQAGATNIHVVFGFDGKGEKKPNSYAIIDDGLGMIPAMLGFAAKWGGTDRENDRSGLGRYGYGLPSSCVSQGRRFRIFSRTAGDVINGIAVDLDDLRMGEGGRVPAPKPAPVELPVWVKSYVDEHFCGLPHGTIVLVDKLDRLTWTTRDGLRKNLLEHVGLVYRTYLEDRTFIIDGVAVEPIDPLFLTSGARYNMLPDDEDRALPYEPTRIPMKAADGTTVVVKVRAAYLLPRFGYIDKKTTKNTAKNPRNAVMADHEGLIVMRMGRQMDVITRHPWGDEGRLSSWRAEDRYWQIELDFPADLDEKFSVTTSKQSVRLDDSIWDALEKAGIKRLISDIKGRYKQDAGKIKSAEGHDRDQKRPSEQAMENATEFKGTRPSAEQSAAAERNQSAVVIEAERAAEQTGLPFGDVKAALESDIARRPFAIREEAAYGAPFYRAEGMGGQVRVWLNQTHPFFTDLYAGPKSTPEIQAALEVLLLVIAGEEVNAMDKRLEFYERERSRWSDELRTALRELAKIMPETRNAGGPDAET